MNYSHIVEDRPPIRAIVRAIDRLDLLAASLDTSTMKLLRRHSRMIEIRKREPRLDTKSGKLILRSPHQPLRISISQPRPGIAPILDRLIAAGLAKLSAAEFATDLLVDGERDAIALLDYFAARFRPRTRRSAIGTSSCRAAYFGNSRAKCGPCATLAAYVGFSKFVPDWCCMHWEDRIRGASRLKRAGVVTAADAFRVAADRAWSDPRVRFFEIDFAKLGACYAGRPRRVRAADAEMGRALLDASRGRLDQLLADMATHDRSPSRRGRPKVGVRWLSRIADPFADVPSVARHCYTTVQTRANVSDTSIKPSAFPNLNKSSVVRSI